MKVVKRLSGSCRNFKLANCVENLAGFSKDPVIVPLDFKAMTLFDSI